MWRFPRSAHLAPALLLLVTQGELILVQEVALRGAGRYGTTWRCLPLLSIRGVTLAPQPARGLASLRVTLPEGSEVRADIEASRLGALRAFLEEVDPRWGEPAEAPPPPGPTRDPFEEAPPP